MAVKPGKRAARRNERAERYRKRVPRQPEGMPMGKHLAGFKGSKTDVPCYCGGCSARAKSVAS